MKKTFLALIAVTLVYIACPAQFGILGGVNFSKYEYVSDRKAIISWNAGLLYRITKKNSAFAVQPQFTYTGKGAVKYPEIDINNDVLKYTNHINYLQLSLPFIVSPKLDDEGILRFDIGAGPYVANVVNATSTAESYEGETTTLDFKVGSSTTDDFKPFDAGITMMAGTRIANISFNVQYDLGLLNVNPVTTAPPLKMRAFMFNLLIYFGK